MNCSMLEQLAGKRIGILGYGRDGRAALEALLARQPAAELTVLVESGTPGACPVPLLSGPFDQRLGSFDVLIRSPGVPVDHPALVAARRVGTRVVNPVSIWLAERAAGRTVIGVTGSKGKSTTASLLAHLFGQCGRSVLLAGNIGVPVLAHLDTEAEIVVLELSSYQLADLEGALDLGLITRLFPEHLDWHGSSAAYFASKLRLAELLGGKPLLINATDPVLVEQTRGVQGLLDGNRPPAVHRDGDALKLGSDRLCERAGFPLIGRHNLDNAALALQAAILLGHTAPELVAALAGFEPLPHRLEPVASLAGVRYINDSIATNPHATLAALEALAPAPVILLVGGQARPADWSPVLDRVADHGLAGLIGLPDNGAELVDLFQRRAGRKIARMECCDDLDQAVIRASALAVPGDQVLLSPGAPSFNQFRDFEQRGERFRQAVAGQAARSTA